MAANLNRVLLIGRLTRDPEVKVFANGGKVAQFGLAVNNRRKNRQTGQWEDAAVFLDVAAFNRGEHGKTADLVEQYLTKGQQVFLEGHLQLDEWVGQDGTKRSKLKIVAESVQFLERRQDGGSRPAASNSESWRGPRQPAEQPARRTAATPADELPPSGQDLLPSGAEEDGVPF